MSGGWERALAFWRYRELLGNLVSRDLKVKYRGSVLGFLWSLAHPLAFLGVYTLAFTVILPAQSVRQFPLFFLCGYLPWICIHQSIMLATASLVEHGGLIKKVAFPREVLPLAACLSLLVNFLLTLGAVMPFLWLGGHWPHRGYLWLPLLAASQLVTTTGAVLGLSVAYVRYRDLGYLLDLGLSLLFWLTPIVYPREIAPPAVRAVLSLNPVAWLVEGYRTVLLRGGSPDAAAVTLQLAFASAMLWFGWRAFLAGSRDVAERV